MKTERCHHNPYIDYSIFQSVRAQRSTDKFAGLPHLFVTAVSALLINQICTARVTHQLGKSTAFPLAPKTAKLSMKRMIWLPPSSAAESR